MTKPQTTVYINKVSLADLEWQQRFFFDLMERLWGTPKFEFIERLYIQAVTKVGNHPEHKLSVKLAPYQQKVAKLRKAHKKSEPAQKELTEVVNASLKQVVSHG